MRWLALLLLFCSTSEAAVSLGGGYSSVTDGRLVPTLHLAIGSKAIDVTGYSTGVRTTRYSFVGYTLAVQKTWEADSFLWGPLTGGIGWGLHVANRKLEEDAGTVAAWDWVTGPAFRVRWQVAGPVFVSIESIFGLRDLFQHLILNFQTVTHGAVGVRF